MFLYYSRDKNERTLNFTDMRHQINKLRKHYTGCYRITLNDRLFAQIKKDGSFWSAEIRNNESGDIERYAGLWDKRGDAINECISLSK